MSACGSSWETDSGWHFCTKAPWHSWPCQCCCGETEPDPSEDRPYQTGDDRG
jgi:hypothetical protein